MDNRAMIRKSLDYIEENLCAEITAAELLETNKQMTLWLIDCCEERKNI